MTKEEAEQEFMESEAVVAGLQEDTTVSFLKCSFCNRSIRVYGIVFTARCRFCGTAYSREVLYDHPGKHKNVMYDTNGDAWRKKFA